jgi:hypothetical protein
VIEEQASVHEIEPAFAAPVETAEESAEAAGSGPGEAESQTEEKPVRKRRASPGIKRKTVAPRAKGASTTAKRTSKKPTSSTESDRGNA